MSSVVIDALTPMQSEGACLVQLLPCPAALTAQRETFWSRLGIWHARIVGERLPDPAQVAVALERHGTAMLQVLAEWLEIAASPAGPGPALAEHLAHNADAPWAQTLLLTIELLQNRRYEAVAACSRLLLPTAAVDAVAGAGLTPRGTRLAYALLLYGQAPANLELLTLYERAERFAYARHRLLDVAGLAPADAHNGAGHRRPSAWHHSPGALEAEAVDAVLAQFEQRSANHTRSLCLRVLPESGGYVVFIHRVLREASIHELERTLFGDEAELIVLKFAPGYAVLEEHSTRGIGRQIGAALAGAMLGRQVCYVGDDTITSRAAVGDFLAYLRQGTQGDALCLVELQLRQAPLDGSPALVLRSQHGEPLAPALNAFAGHAIRLLDDLDDVRAIAVAFSPDGGPGAPHLFRIRFDPAGSDLVLHYTGAQSSRHLRARFEAHLRDEHGITVVPTAI